MKEWFGSNVRRRTGALTAQQHGPLEERQLFAHTFGETLPQVLGGVVALTPEGGTETMLTISEGRIEALEKALVDSAG